MSTDRIEMRKVEGHPGAMVWADKENPGVFYLTNSRGNHRSTRQLEAQTLDSALKEAKDALK
jgi:hypothetical protein